MVVAMVVVMAVVMGLVAVATDECACQYRLGLSELVGKNYGIFEHGKLEQKDGSVP
jgi:hypothetical protein